MRSPLLHIAALCLLANFGAAQQPPKKSALDRATLEAYVRHLFVWGPQIGVKIGELRPAKQLPGFQEVTVTASAGNASQEELFLISADGKKIVRGTVFDVTENPFAVEAAKLKTEDVPAFGPAAAPVSLVLFSDFQCSFCREEAKVVREQLVKEYPTQVRVYFKDFPLEPIHPWAKPAAIAGRCIFRQKPAAFWDFHDLVFDKQSEFTVENLKSKVLEFAVKKDVEPVQLSACLASPAAEAEVTKSQTEARSLGVNSTPTIFLNGRRLVGQLGWPDLKRVIEHEIEYQKTQSPAAKCCEVTLPTPFKAQ